MVFDYRFRPTVFATLLAMAGFGLFASLAIWQVNRAAEKQSLQASVERRLSMKEISLSTLNADADDLYFIRVEGRGYFEKGEDILLDNIVYQGAAGYYLYSLLKLDNREERVLINRGWLPMGKSRDEMPMFTTPEDHLVVHGVIAKPRSRPVVLGNVDKPNFENEQVWLYLDLDYLEKQTGYSIMPFVIRMDANDPLGYVREWPRFDARISMHIGYAIQWAVFALVVLVVFVGVNMKKTKKENRQE